MIKDFTPDERERIQRVCPGCLHLYDSLTRELEEYNPSFFTRLKYSAFEHRREILFGLGIGGLTGLGALITYFVD